MHDSNLKGAIAEQAFVLAAVKAGIPVLKPVSEHGRCDLALDFGGRLWRVQCKWGRLSDDGDVVIVHISGSRRAATGFVITTYAEHEVDLFGIYCGDLDRCFLVPVSLAAGKHMLHLRIGAPRNGQRACINLASSFDFEGAIAQLGERVNGIHEVVGSSPTSSTSTHDPPTASTANGVPTIIGAHTFREQLGWWMDRAAAGEEIVVTRHGKPRLRLSPAEPIHVPS
jgi:prevent-host-death family protein